tara:strand:+ start:33 stop:1016 length:984 start_codon:yes stop_codon:yes gene_type:complete
MFIIKLKARKFSIPLIVLCIFIGLDAQTKNERLIEKKQRLQELLGLEPDGSLKEEAFEILSQNLESLGIEDNELIDGYEFIGGYWGFQEYLDNNIDRLLKVLGDEGGSEFWEEEEEYVDDEEYEDYGEYEEDGEYEDDELEIDELFYDDPEYEESNDENETQTDTLKRGKNRSTQEYSFNYYVASPIIKSNTLSTFDVFEINGVSFNTPFILKIGSLDPAVVVELRNYKFEMVEADSVISTFGGSFAFLIGLYKNFTIKGFDIVLSALTGGFHAGNGVILSGDTNLRFGAIPVGVGTHVRLNVLSKDEGGITGWVDLGISLVYSFKI